MSWANSELFVPKLKRYVENAESKAQEDAAIWAFLTEGADLPDSSLRDVHATITKIDAVTEKLESVEQLTKRIRAIADEDQPSQ